MISRSDQPNKGYSKKKFFVFNPVFEFLGTIPTIKDFVENVEINCYGVLNTGPYLFKTRKSKLQAYIRKEDHEIFKTEEECIQFYNEVYLKKWTTFTAEWTKISMRYLENSIQWNFQRIEQEKRMLKNNKEKLQKFTEALERYEEIKELNEQWI